MGKICGPVLGNMKIENINVTFLAKQKWKFVTQSDNIWVIQVKAKYLEDATTVFSSK